MLVCLTITNDTTTNDWLYDPGSSEKIANHKSWFETYEELQQEKTFKIGDGRVNQALGKGDVRVEAYVNGKWRSALMKDVYYVPVCPYNLWTPYMLTEYRVKRDRKGNAWILNGDEPLLEGTVENNVIWLKIRKPTPSLYSYSTSEHPEATPAFSSHIEIKNPNHDQQ